MMKVPSFYNRLIQLGCIASLHALDLSMGHQSLEADHLWGLIMGEVIPLVGSE